MKKLLGIVVLGLLWCNVGSAEEKICQTLNECLVDGYVKKDRISIKGDRYHTLIYEMEKRKELIHCIVKYRYSGYSTFLKESYCVKP